MSLILFLFLLLWFWLRLLWLWSPTLCLQYLLLWTRGWTVSSKRLFCIFWFRAEVSKGLAMGFRWKAMGRVLLHCLETVSSGRVCIGCERLRGRQAPGMPTQQGWRGHRSCPFGHLPCGVIYWHWCTWAWKPCVCVLYCGEIWREDVELSHFMLAKDWPGLWTSKIFRFFLGMRGVLPRQQIWDSFFPPLKRLSHEIFEDILLEEFEQVPEEDLVIRPPSETRRWQRHDF